MTTLTEAYRWHRKDREETLKLVQKMHQGYVKWDHTPGALPPLEMFKAMQRLFKHYGMPPT